jgi:hypothetical protein
MINDFLDTHRRWARVAIVIGTLSLFAAYLRISIINPKNSDDASFALQAQDILHGNVLLHGWITGPDVGITTFIPLHVICGMLTPHLADMMYIVPAISYLLLVIVCVAITWVKSEPKYRLLSTLIVLIIVGLPSLYDAGPPFQTGGDHKSTVLLVLVTFYLLSTGYNIWLAQLPLMLAAVGDPMAIWIGILAVGLVGVLLLDRGQIRMAWHFMISAVGCLLVAKTVIAAIPMLGGFHITQSFLKNTFVALDRFPHNIRILFECTLDLFQANPFGRDVVDLGTAVALIHLGVLIFLIWVAWKIAAIALQECDTFRLLLLSALILNVLAYVLSTTAFGPGSARYLPTLPIFGPILVGLSWYKVGVPEKPLWLAIPIVAAAFLIPFVTHLSFPIPEKEESLALGPSDPEQAIEFLEENQLTEGYGGYWSACIFTVLSDGKVKVRQVGAGEDGKLLRLDWYSARRWYDMKNARFLIYRDNTYNVNELTGIKTWGPPSDRISIGGYVILIWPQPLKLMDGAVAAR